MNVKLRIASRPAIRVKIIPTFPTNVIGEAGITIDRENGNYVISIDSIPASRISFTPSAKISATNVQDAIDEISDEQAFADGASILDSNLNELLTFGVTESAVNNLKITNAATGNAPKLSVIGDDSNIALRYATKGTGSHIWEVNSIAELELNSTELFPSSDLGLSLGTASKRFDKLNNFDISSAANLFGAIKQDASETATGVIELATTSEAIAGTDTTRGVTPAGLRAATREKLTAARTYYVRTDGSDANNGLADNAGGAFLTIQKALDVVFGTLDLGGKNVTIQVGAGTYTGAVTASAPQVGSGTITILGDTTTPSNVYLNVTGTAITVSNYASLSVSGVKIAGTNFGIVASIYGTVTIAGKVEFAACGTAHMRAQTCGQISCQGISYTISGSSQTHARADGGLGFINLFGSTATLTGSPVFSTGFAFADRLSIISAGSFSSSGSTGSSSKRYSATLNGVIYTAGGGASFFPGDTSGTTATGGQYA